MAITPTTIRVSDRLSRMARRALHIAWLGPVPGEDSGVPGVATELLHGLAKLGHSIDCFFPESERELPRRVTQSPNLNFVWSSSGWEWDRWYSRNKVGAFATSLLSRGQAFLRLRKEVVDRHRQRPYDVIYQFSNIETLGVPARLSGKVPLVVHPETHVGGELRWLLRDWRLSLRCQPAYVFVIVAAVMCLRALGQRVMIQRASLLICISAVFRDHVVRDYRFPRERTVVVPNPIRIERFEGNRHQSNHEPTVLVLGRIALRKGIETVIAVALKLSAEEAGISFRIIGGPSLWSDYRRLLEDLPPNARYLGQLNASDIPREMCQSDILLQASKYEPFALTVAEGLAAGLPVVATSEVGAIEGIDRRVVAEVEPGNVTDMAAAVTRLLAETRSQTVEMRSLARCEAARAFNAARVCGEISVALEELVAGASMGWGGE
jgi:glycosyltransferase involved in cell wall biosynthesis